MQRTIKFRGKRLDTGEWVCGDLFHPSNGTQRIYWTTQEKHYTAEAEARARVEGQQQILEKILRYSEVHITAKPVNWGPDHVGKGSHLAMVPRMCITSELAALTPKPERRSHE